MQNRQDGWKCGWAEIQLPISPSGHHDKGEEGANNSQWNNRMTQNITTKYEESASGCSPVSSPVQI
jgi:hypothetical protein